MVLELYQHTSLFSSLLCNSCIQMKHLVIACSTMKEEVNRFKADGISFNIFGTVSPPHSSEDEGGHFHPRCPERMGECNKMVPELQRSGRNIGWPATGYNKG